ncbi:PorP/SprF family type IX secretion system membrane protein [Lutimonas zeaxanthinifaciens]|uniref:PorP/SprF family type IX secretion system membrane protein n=1 Tax=Lutimonas zeaxanthinifaciens TaxID=3060215 RepID=UPI00265CAB86|nr:type IX secretion system membrane protein PorP/SprF [Lutimonas sp. YSD2104]WKK65805.1 type IX secretion system membrane protein PorP/SprF [Lutimonas sp. YSD2104]
MRNLKLYIVLGLLLWITDFYGQQDPQYTQYMYNMNIVNPAYAGSRGTLSLGLLGRSQWTNVNGAPKTMTFDAHAPVGKKVGMGLSVIADEIGPAKEQNIYADFSYTLTTSDEGRLAFGLKGGVTLLNVNLLDVVLPQTATGDDPLFDENINDAFPNIGAGVYYYNDKWYAGFSVPNIMKSEHLDKDNVNTKASEEVHYFLTTGYVFDLSSTLKFKPSVLVKGVTGAPVSFDINANFLMYDRFELGASYRYQDAVSILFNFGVTRAFRIGYAYDYTISEFSNANTGGSHEIILLYDIDFTKKNLKSPRFF